MLYLRIIINLVHVALPLLPIINNHLHYLLAAELILLI